jgi:hypothetical protein
MQWDDCNALFDTLISNPADDWYLYDTTAVLPVATIDAEHLVTQLKSIKFIIEIQHQERYCGIVYVDDLNRVANECIKQSITIIPLHYTDKTTLECIQIIHERRTLTFVIIMTRQGIKLVPKYHD